MTQKIEVGEVKEDGLRLWCARLSLKYAKEDAKKLDDAVERLQNRASNMMGWIIPIVIALTTVLFARPTFYYSSLIMLVFMLCAAFFCLIVLNKVSPMYININFDKMRVIQDIYKSELEVIEALTIEYDQHNSNYQLIYSQLQYYMKCGWMCLFSTVVLGAAVQILINIFSK